MFFYTNARTMLLIFPRLLIVDDAEGKLRGHACCPCIREDENEYETDDHTHSLLNDEHLVVQLVHIQDAEAAAVDIVSTSTCEQTNHTAVLGGEGRLSSHHSCWVQVREAAAAAAAFMEAGRYSQSEPLYWRSEWGTEGVWGGIDMEFCDQAHSRCNGNDGLRIDQSEMITHAEWRENQIDYILAECSNNSTDDDIYRIEMEVKARLKYRMMMKETVVAKEACGIDCQSAAMTTSELCDQAHSPTANVKIAKALHIDAPTPLARPARLSKVKRNKKCAIKLLSPEPDCIIGDGIGGLISSFSIPCAGVPLSISRAARRSRARKMKTKDEKRRIRLQASILRVKIQESDACPIPDKSTQVKISGLELVAWSQPSVWSPCSQTVPVSDAISSVPLNDSADGWETVHSFCPCPVGNGVLIVDISDDPDEQLPKYPTLAPEDERLIVVVGSHLDEAISHVYLWTTVTTTSLQYVSRMAADSMARARAKYKAVMISSLPLLVKIRFHLLHPTVSCCDATLCSTATFLPDSEGKWWFMPTATRNLGVTPKPGILLDITRKLPTITECKPKCRAGEHRTRRRLGKMGSAFDPEVRAASAKKDATIATLRELIRIAALIAIGKQISARKASVKLRSLNAQERDKLRLEVLDAWTCEERMCKQLGLTFHNKKSLYLLRKRYEHSRAARRRRRIKQPKVMPLDTSNFLYHVPLHSLLALFPILGRL